MSNRKLVLYISMSLDGFLATKDDDLSFLSIVEKYGEDYGYLDFTASVDTYIVGSKTYETVLKLTGGEFPQAKMYNCYVITRKERENENGITFYNGDIEQLIQKIKSEDGKNIYCDGGGQIVKLLMEKNLIDEYMVSIIPIILGDGKRLFLGETPTINLKPLGSSYYKTGLVLLRYLRKSKP